MYVSHLAGSFYPYKMQFEVTKADSHKRTQHNSIEVIIPDELLVRVLLKIEIETSVCRRTYLFDIRSCRIRRCLVEDGRILLRTYSTMMATDNVALAQDNSYDSLLENAQRTVFLKELFTQVISVDNDQRYISIRYLVVSRSIGHDQYYSTGCYEKFHSMLGSLFSFVVLDMS
jgi:hypothetical protein